MKKITALTISLFIIFTALQLFSGCEGRRNPLALYMVPTPVGGCDNAGSFGVKTGDVETVVLKANDIYVSQFQIPYTLDVFSISVESAQYNGAVFVGIYDGSGNLISSSMQAGLDYGWNAISIPKVTIGPGTYNIAVQPVGDLNMFVAYKDGGQTYVFSSTIPSLPASLSNFARNESWMLMTYADFCPL